MSSNPYFHSRVASLRPLFSAFLIATAVAPTGLCAVRAAGESAPPVYPDCEHFHNGCHISAVTYLARFEADFPEERGHPAITALPSANGITKPHTVALVSWRGEWWCRDEYFGVFRLHCPSNKAPDLRGLERHFQDNVSIVARSHRVRPLNPDSTLSVEQRRRDTTHAAAKLPFPNTLFWVHQGETEVPLVLFRTGPGEVALYDPAHGTAVAKCTVTEDVRVAAAIAVRLGYRADGIRADISSVRGGLMVAANPTGRDSMR